MLIYKGTKREFLKDVYSDQLEIKVETLIKEKLHRRTSKTEFLAWKNSMQYMYKVMSTKSIPDDCGVAIEYSIPNTNKRVDFIIAGEDHYGRKNAVIIELKQWTTAEKVENSDGLVKTILNNNMVAVAHPSYQAWSYASAIRDYNENIEKQQILLTACAYLHNYVRSEDNPILDEIYNEYLCEAPVFFNGEVSNLAQYISKHIKKGNTDVLRQIDTGKIRPSKMLQDCVQSMLNGNQEFILLDKQKVVYEKALALVKEKTNCKKVYILQGGPGTGKSVLAVNLLVDILRMSKNVAYVSKSTAPRKVYNYKLKGKKRVSVNTDDLFKGSGSFINSKLNQYDCLLVDEAHRVTEKSTLFSAGENQIKEIINASKVSIFFIDEHQRVTLQDIGSKREIFKWAKIYDAQVYQDKLESQFRCNGSDGYIAWLDDVLGIEDSADKLFSFDYDFRMIDNPNELCYMIKKRNEVNNKSRIVAGYCWEWRKATKKDPEFHEIVIDEKDFSMSWNLESAKIWAIDPDSINQVGCVHTCQGLEFDYVGVIIGEDLICRDGVLYTDYTKRASTDKSLKGLKKLIAMDKERALKEADEIIRNTYRTLLSRGQKGCYVYCVDDELQEYFKNRLRLEILDDNS